MRTLNFKWRLAITGTLIAAALAGWQWPRGTQTGAKGKPFPATPAKMTTAPPANPGPTNWDNQLHTAANDLSEASDATGRNRVLERLSQTLAAGDKSEISAAIRRFLDSKLDGPTGQGFKIGQKGYLAEAPTLRTFLLDQLGRIDPAAAAEYAKLILQSKDSPDEWALALRNLAAGDTSPEVRAWLAQKTGELLAAKDWQQNPSAGYLEAFDTVVYLGGVNFVPALAGMVCRQDNPALAHAAFLSLDRLVINDPAALLATLLAQPGLLPGRDQTRADYFARADAGDSQQSDLLQNYLLNPRTSAAEREQFAGIFPNANFMVSPNLLTTSPAPDPGEIKKRDAAALKAVQQWLADPRFASVRPELEKIQARLQDYARQAGQP